MSMSALLLRRHCCRRSVSVNLLDKMSERQNRGNPAANVRQQLG